MGEPGKIYLGQAVQNLQTSPDWGAYTKVILKVSDEAGYVSGTDGGLVLEADCPWATQQIADDVLAAMSGVTYKPYEATKAYIDPAVELGDAITADGFYSGIYTLKREFSHTAAADISAPCSTEVAHEMQYTSAEERRFVRMSKKITAEFAVLADRLVAKVAGEHSSFGWELLETGMTWYANNSEIMKIDQGGVTISGTLSAPAVIAGQLNVGGTDISAATLRQGASDGYNWGSGGGSYQGYASRASYSLSGSSFGFDFDDATYQYSQHYPAHFVCGTLHAETGIRFGGKPFYLTSTNVRLASGGTATIYYVSYTDG